MSADPRAAYDAVAAELEATAGARKGAMFGMPCLKYGSKAFAGFTQQAMVFKLGAAAHGEALALAGAHLFDPSGQGRPMKEWVVVPFEHVARWSELGRAALEYIAAAS